MSKIKIHVLIHQMPEFSSSMSNLKTVESLRTKLYSLELYLFTILQSEELRYSPELLKFLEEDHRKFEATKKVFLSLPPL